ncbi:MAG: chloride channel protein [Hyphomicrobiales bacterium]
MASLHRIFDIVHGWISPNWRAFAGTKQPQLWILAVFIGFAVSVFAILFRVAIGAVQWVWLGQMSERIATTASSLPWWVVLLAPAAGGLIVGVILQFFHPGRRAGGVADVIEARVAGSEGLGFMSGMRSAVITAISLGSGASAGREGPIVHLGATLASAVTCNLGMSETNCRILLACGVASAVSSSFNAPIAGVLFAHEVILGHYATTAFVPIVIASVCGTILSRVWFGDVAAFEIPIYQITSYLEFPAFFLLGIVCAIAAVAFQFSLIGTDYLARRLTIPFFLRPVIGGFLVGGIALSFPQVLGVGYEATDQALKQQLPLTLMLALIVAKTAATSITLASRFGGGIFSPALYIGAMTGGAFGIIAASVFPEMASSQGLYAILGMGAVAAAVIGAPISTTMIVFELTGGYGLTIALLLTVSVAVGLTIAIHGRSYFHWQLEMRGLFVNVGPHKYLVQKVRVAEFLQPPDPENDAEFLAEGYAFDEDRRTLLMTDTLETALRTFDETGQGRIPVLWSGDNGTFAGWALEVKALAYFNDALIDAHVEEHR